MRKSLSKLPAPILAGVVKERDKAAAIAEIKNNMYNGADMIDLHISCLDNDDTETLRQIISSSKLPVLALNYNTAYDLKNAGYTEEERVASFLRAVEAGADGVDIQGYTFDPDSMEKFNGEDKYSFTKGNPAEIVTDDAIIAKQCDFIEKVHSKGAQVLLSCHPGIPMNTTQVVELALFLEKRNPDIIKIVTGATNEDEMVECIKTMCVLKKEVKTPVSFHANGPFGALTRIVNPALGGKVAFCVNRFQIGAALEQIDLRTARSVIDNMKKILL